MSLSLINDLQTRQKIQPQETCVTGSAQGFKDKHSRMLFLQQTFTQMLQPAFTPVNLNQYPLNQYGRSTTGKLGPGGHMRPLRCLIRPPNLEEMILNLVFFMQCSGFPTRWRTLGTLTLLRCGVFLHVCALLFDPSASARMSGPKGKRDRDRWRLLLRAVPTQTEK